MPHNTDKSDQAFRELVHVLEEAVQAGADSVGLNYEDRNWIVYHNFGNTGLGAARIAQELQWDVIGEIDKRAGLSRKARGKMQVRLLGMDYEVAVDQHESFGESVFKLTLRERKDKAAVPSKKKKQSADSQPQFVGNSTPTYPPMISLKRRMSLNVVWMIPCDFL